MRTLRYKCDLCLAVMEPNPKEFPTFIDRDADICETCLDGIIKYKEISTRTGKPPRMEEQ